MLDGYVHFWWITAYLVVSAYILEECMFNGNVHTCWMTPCLMDKCMFGG